MDWWNDAWEWLGRGEGWRYDVALVLLGAILGWVVGWWSGRKTSKRVDETHDKLTWLIRGMESEGMVTFKRDEDGNITGVVINASASITGTSNVTVTAHPVIGTAERRKGPWWPLRRSRL